ncbi:hypothetical protein HPB48_022871 [Haemaphysalis longicornis]|uniref:Uncharacterized protein n=1 Tax=Haemaphysalis longicornis TaxID=44386 RepID=A0A9J6GYX3_HAELO|nr:hypothetical protein HPB48_022871 [Haemaphysalis longicornis]
MSFGRDPPRRNGNSTGTLKRLTTEARLPKLPAGHFRVMIRPRGGIDVKKIDKMTFMKATSMATGVSYEQGKLDMLCPNYGQNIYTISTPRLENPKGARTVCPREKNKDKREGKPIAVLKKNSCTTKFVHCVMSSNGRCSDNHEIYFLQHRWAKMFP